MTGRNWMIAAGALVLLGVAGFAVWSGSAGRKDAPVWRTAKVERGALVAAVSAAGTLAPVTTVQVGSQVSGQIKELLADFNSEVKAGQPIARLDPDSFEARVAQAAAEVEVARAAVMVQQANMLRARTDTDRAAVGATDAEREFNRKRDLAERGAGTAAERDRQEASALGARASLQGARASQLMADAQLASAMATLKQREAALRQAQIDLDRTVIRAPVDGTVIQRNIDAGQTVAASLQAPVLFTIAQDLREMQIETSVDEADIGRLREGMPATFTVDALPGREFSGAIRQIRKAAQVVQNVVTYTVVITADNSENRLLPGLTANVRIIADQRDSTLKVPNAALRFRPPAGVKLETATPAAGAPAGAPEGGPAQLRDRLVQWLKLDDNQTQALDRIFDETRQKIGSLGSAELDERQRSQAIERIRAESRTRIAQILRPDQRELYLARQDRRDGTTEGRVVVLRDGKPTALPVRIGISDGAMSELVGGGLKEGDEVVTGASGGGATPPAGAPGPRLRL